MDADEIIGSAKPEMRAMLGSVYAYNLRFARTANDRKLLLRILEAMSSVDRKFFAAGKAYAYEDSALSIGEGQTISQPSTVARMIFLLQLKQGDNALEIGTGSGWNASLMAFLAYPGSVTSAERISSLAEKAKSNIGAFKKYLKNADRLSKINIIAKDVFSAKSLKDKYDKIIFTAGIADRETEKAIFSIAKKLLKKNGILVCPYTSGQMLILTKENNKTKAEKTNEEYVFVPLVRQDG